MKPPKVIRFGITNRCNLRCSFCDLYKGESRPERDDMPEDIFYKGIDCVLEAGFFKEVHFVHFGEALIHPRCMDYISYAKSKSLKTFLVTNGLLLSSKCDEILNSKLDRIKISVDTLDGNLYSKYRAGVKLKGIIAGIERLYEQRNKKKSNLEIIVQGMAPIEAYEPGISFDQKWEQYKEFFRGKCDTLLFGAMMTNETHQGSVLRIKKHCNMIGNVFTIMTDGRVTTCCMDSTGQMSIGSINDNTLKELYKGPRNTGFKVQEFLAKKVNRNFAPRFCKSCFINPPYRKIRFDFDRDT